MKLTSKQTYKVIYYILENHLFTQTNIHKITKVSLGRINEIIQWLIEKKFVEKTNKRFELIDPAGLISLFSLYRNMNHLTIKKFPLRLSKKQIINKLPEKSILCLDSALETYSDYWRSDRVCIYANKKQLKQIENIFKPLIGGNTHLWVFNPDISPETIKQKKITKTSKLRTLIDLISDNKTFYAKDLFKQLWNLQFEE